MGYPLTSGLIGRTQPPSSRSTASPPHRPLRMNNHFLHCRLRQSLFTICSLRHFVSFPELKEVVENPQEWLYVSISKSAIKLETGWLP
jgi:hypothetical protein